MIIKNDEGLVLTSKGLEQLHYNSDINKTHSEQLNKLEQKLIELIDQEHSLEKIVPFILSHSIDPKAIEGLVDLGFLEVAPLDYIEEIKKSHQEQFSINIANEIDKINDYSPYSEKNNEFNSINDNDFSKKEEKFNEKIKKSNNNHKKILTSIDSVSVSILSDKSTFHHKTITNLNNVNSQNSYVNLNSILIATPEKRGFEEIKNLLKVNIKQAFPIKFFVYNIKINKISNMKELNNFLTNILIDLEQKQGKEITEELISRINTIKHNNNLENIL